MQNRKITKILIANRGEIAVRIIRACREMGISSVAVYSDADREALHVQLADEAICVGPPPPLVSYLNMDAIVEAARTTRADAIHPGYGFLAENHLFAQRCEEEEITFIGPGSEALRLVGDKLASRETMAKAGIPIIPGMTGRGGELLAEARRIGYPVLVKASAGGGGKGMRVVRSDEELTKAIEAGRREARSAFGDETVYIEKYLRRPRHVEFQIIADTFGRVVHLYERECSIQRRHQKIVEETPSTALDDRLRRQMGEVAVEVARVSGYTNAGTVEFLLDDEVNFFFLEVNARLQVEHPITELTTGVDLVREQIRIASGLGLNLRQEELAQRGHAIECRIYAEDPENGFLPSPGRILFMREPSGPGIRHDCGIFSGCQVPVHYDPILSKVIVWAEDREAARRRMIGALSDYVILGIKTTIEFLRDVMDTPAFASGDTHTDFIDIHMADWGKTDMDTSLLDPALAAAAIDAYRSSQLRGEMARQRVLTPWQTLGKWEIGTQGV